VAADPLADQHREPAVPVGEEAVQVGAGRAGLAGDEQCPQRLLDPLTHALGEHVAVVAVDADGIGQFTALEAAADVELEQDAVALVEPFGGLPHQVLEFGGLERCLDDVGSRRRLEHLVLGGPGAGRLPEALHDFVPGDGKEPGPELGRVAELTHPFEGEQEGLLGGVGRLVGVAADPETEVVEGVGVAVVDAGQGIGVAGCERGRQCGIGGRHDP